MILKVISENIITNKMMINNSISMCVNSLQRLKYKLLVFVSSVVDSYMEVLIHSLINSPVKKHL